MSALEEKVQELAELEEKFLQEDDRFNCINKIVQVTKNVEILEKKWIENELDRIDLTPFCGTIAKVIEYSAYDSCIELKWASGDIGWVPCSACVVVDDNTKITALNNSLWPIPDFILTSEQENKITLYFPHYKKEDKHYESAKVLYYKTVCLLEQNGMKEKILKYADLDSKTNFSQLFHTTPIPTFKKEYPLYGKTIPDGKGYAIELKKLYIEPTSKEDTYPLVFIGSISFFHELMHWIGFVYLRDKGKGHLRSPTALGKEAGYYFELQCTKGLWGLSFIPSGEGAVEYLSYFRIDDGWIDLRPVARAHHEKAFIVDRKFAVKYVHEYHSNEKFWDQIDSHIRYVTRLEIGKVERARNPHQSNPLNFSHCGKDYF